VPVPSVSRWKSRRAARRRPAGDPSSRSRDEFANPYGAHHGSMASSQVASMLGKPPLQSIMARGRRPPSKGGRLLHNHPTASVDGPVRGPTLSFRLLYGLLILQHIAPNPMAGSDCAPTAEWISRQLTEAYGWKVQPRYIVRDATPSTVTSSSPPSAMGIRDRPTAADRLAERVL